MKLNCWKCVYLLLSAAFIVLSTNSFADTATARQVLAQSTTNPYCSAGSNEFNPFEASKLIDSNQYKSQCPSGMSYVQCLRETFKKQNQ